MKLKGGIVSYTRKICSCYIYMCELVCICISLKTPNNKLAKKLEKKNYKLYTFICISCHFIKDIK